MNNHRDIPLVVFGLLLPYLTVSAEVDPNAPVGVRSDKALAGGALRFWPEREDQARVICATFFGGAGNEWLVGAGIQPDGTVVVAGNVIGPVLDLGVPAGVLGKDTTPPAPPQRVPAKDGKGNPKFNKQGEAEFESPSWRHESVTGFVARLSPDLKRTISVVRFPWESAALTSCVVAPDGSIYVAGRARAGLTGAGPFKDLPASPDATRKEGACDRTFVAKFSATTVLEWGYETAGLSDAPRLSMSAAGNVTYGAQELKTLDPAGRVVSSVVIPGGVRASTSVSPVDGTIAKGGEHHWPTGREPYRCPTLNILKPDGTLKIELYNWNGPYVGLDNSRLVSDSAVQLVTHDRAGNVLLSAWSDGGNSVMTREATDMRRGVPSDGVGLNSAGAGVTSFAYLVKLDPKDYSVVGWTFWCSKFGNKANGVTVSALGQAVDGSFCIAGGSAWGLVQTTNRLAKGEPGGEYLAVFNEDLTGVRFSSAIPGAGIAEVDDNGNPWAISSGIMVGKPVVLFAGSAAADGDAYGLVTATPVINASQPKFGGGWSDGYLVILDLSGKTAGPGGAPPGKVADARLTAETRARTINKKNLPERPAEGTVFQFSPAYPKYVTADVEARAASGTWWPSFLFGKPAGGTLAIKNGALSGQATVLCDNWVQTSGEQNRRILGELVPSNKEKPTAFQFTITHVDAPVQREVPGKNKEGKRTVEIARATGVVEFAGRKLPVNGDCTVTYEKPRDGGATGVGIDVYFTCKSSDLGLRAAGNEELDFRVGLRGTTESGPPPKPPKK